MFLFKIFFNGCCLENTEVNLKDLHKIAQVVFFQFFANWFQGCDIMTVVPLFKSFVDPVMITTAVRCCYW